MKTQRIILIFLLSIVLVRIYYNMFFLTYDHKKIIEFKGTLAQNPKYIEGSKSSCWLLTLSNNKEFDLQRINVDVTRVEMDNLKKGEKISLYSYAYGAISFSNIRDLIDQRTTVLGMKTKNIRKNNPENIFKNLKRMDEQAFYFGNFTIILAFIGIYSNYKKNKKTT